MKTLLAICIACFASAAAAEVIDLGTAHGAGALRNFSNVPNDGGRAINIVQVTSGYSLYVSIDGITCYTPTGGNPLVITGLVVPCSDGSSITVSLVESFTRKLVGRRYVDSYTIDDGLIER